MLCSIEFNLNYLPLNRLAVPLSIIYNIHTTHNWVFVICDVTWEINKAIFFETFQRLILPKCLYRDLLRLR